MVPAREEFEQSLLVLNQRAALLHATLAIAILVLTIVKWRKTIKIKFATSKYVRLSKGTEGYSAFDLFLFEQTANANSLPEWITLTTDERFYLTPFFYKSRRTVYSIRLGLLVFAFAAITAAFHWYIYTHPQPYLSNVFDQSRQPLRWIEYSITSTIMLVCIASLSEIYDAETLWLIVGVSVAMILTGFSIEEAPGVPEGVSQAKSAWFAVGMGYFVIVWSVILQRFQQSVNFISKNKNLPQYLDGLVKFPNDKLKIPSFVYLIVYGLAFQYLLFPVVMAIGQNATNWAARRHADSASLIIREYGDFSRYAYAFGEWGFIILSFVAKGYLVGNVGLGVIREDREAYVA